MRDLMWFMFGAAVAFSYLIVGDVISDWKSRKTSKEVMDDLEERRKAVAVNIESAALFFVLLSILFCLVGIWIRLIMMTPPPSQKIILERGRDVQGRKRELSIVAMTVTDAAEARSADRNNVSAVGTVQER